MLQFCKRLCHKGIKTTHAITTFISNTMHPHSSTVQFATISDGFDDFGFSQAPSIESYLDRLEAVGSSTLAVLIQQLETFGHPVTCVVYDAFLPWALRVAKRLGLLAAPFFTQSCAANYIYYHAHHGMLDLPVKSLPVELPGMPALELPDMPSFIYRHGSYPAYFEMVLNQFSNMDMADFALVNTFYKLEGEVIDSMSKVSPMMTIGPTIPSFYLDNQVENDKEYGLNLFNTDPSVSLQWLENKPPNSVVYMSFGSMADLAVEQMQELAFGLIGSKYKFMWVVRDSDLAKLSNDLVEEMSANGIMVNWSPQLEVLASGVVGCFFSHAGWNSTIEALSLGVSMVVMPQWTDQTTNAKFVQDVWKVGIRVRVDERGIVGREEVEACIREVMEGEGGKEMKKNAMKWRELAKEAVCEGGTSDRDIDEFVSKLTSYLS
ncbi:hypothetical protein NMG60_11008278 [Bertholletia excelsa]